MPVKHALLALLAERDLTGYELKVRFERALGECWQLNSGQVYSTLDRLQRAGLVARGTGDTTPERTRYTLLPGGRHELEMWLRSPSPHLRAVRDPLYVKLVFCPAARTPALLATLTAETQRYREAVDSLTALVAREPLSLASRTRWLVAEAARLSYQAHLAWLERTSQVLSAYAPSAANGAPTNAVRPAVARRVRAALGG